MGISYRPLWVLLAQKGMKKTDLCPNDNDSEEDKMEKRISPPTLAKLSKNQPVHGKILEKICKILQCQPGDIIEYIPEKEIT